MKPPLENAIMLSYDSILRRAVVLQSVLDYICISIVLGTSYDSVPGQKGIFSYQCFVILMIQLFTLSCYLPLLHSILFTYLIAIHHDDNITVLSALHTLKATDGCIYQFQRRIAR